MSVITWAVEADFDLDTTYETALTSYVARPGNGVRIERQIGADGAYVTSKVTIDFNNTTGAFTPENTASSFYGKMVAGIPIRVTATYSAVTYTVWSGYAQRWKTTWQGKGGASVCHVTCYDLWHYLTEGEPVDVVASTSRDTDGALVAIATSIGLTGSDYSFDDGAQDLPVHWAIGQNPAAAMQDVADSEMFGWLYVNAAGLIVFNSRTSRVGVTPDDTWGDGTTIYPVAVEYDVDPLEYVTSVTARGIRYAVGDADVEVQRWSVSRNNGLHLTAGQVYERTFHAESATVSLTSPAATTDYTANASDDGSGADRTSSLTVALTDLGGGRYTVKLTAALELYVHKFRVRGQPVAIYPDRPEVVVTKQWTGEKAGQAMDLDVPWVDGDSTKLRDYAVQMLRTYRYPGARLGLTFVAGSADPIVALLSVELGDLIRYADTDVGAAYAPYVDDWWYVNRIAIDVPPDWGGAAFNARIGLERSYDHRKLDAIAYDSFDRTNATGDLGTSTSGHTWANDGNMDIASNVARANSDSLQMPNVTLAVGADDQVAEVSLSAIGTGDEVGVVLRYTDADNQLRVYLDKGSNELIAEENVATTVTELASPAFTVGTAHELRAMVQGTRLRVWCDRKMLIDTTTSITTGTKAGLFARNASGTTTFEDWYGQGV